MNIKHEIGDPLRIPSLRSLVNLGKLWRYCPQSMLPECWLITPPRYGKAMLVWHLNFTELAASRSHAWGAKSVNALRVIQATQHQDAAIFLAAWQAATHEANGLGSAGDYCLTNDCPADALELVEMAKQVFRCVGEWSPHNMKLVADFIRERAYARLTLTAILAMLDIQHVPSEHHKHTFARNGVLVGRYDCSEAWALLRALGQPMTPDQFDTAFAALPKD